MPNRTLTSVLLVGLGVGLGYGIGRFLAPPATAVIAQPEREPTAAVSAVVQSVAMPGDADASAAIEPRGTPPRVATLAETATIRSEFDQSAALYALAGPLDVAGILQLLAEAETVLTGGDYLGGTSILMGRFAELDFAAALDYALDARNSAKTQWLRAIFHARARLDVDEAVARAAELPLRLRRVAGMAIARSNDDLSARERRLIAETLQLPPQMIAVAGHQGADAWHEARNIEDPSQRMQTQLQVAMKWGQHDPWAALEATAEIGPNAMRQVVQSQLLAFLAAEDLDAAINWLDAQPAGATTDQMTLGFVNALASRQPEAAERLLTRLPDRQRGQAELSIWTQRAASDPEGAAAWVADNRDEPMLAGASDQLLMTLGMTSQDAADRFMDALPEVERARVEHSYISLLARSDPAAAARRLDEIPDQQQRISASTGLLSQWAQSDPNAALSWLDQRGGAPELYSVLAMSWSQIDPEAVQAEAERMRGGIERDQFIAGTLSSGRVTPQKATELLGRIGDGALRESAKQRQEMMRRVIEQSRGAAFRLPSAVLGVSGGANRKGIIMHPKDG